MGAGVQNGEKEHSIGDLSVEPLVLVKWEPSSLGAKPSENVPAHGHDDNHCVDTEDQTSTTRNPHGELKTVKGSETLITLLLPPVDC
jgi:hypothetical protein